MNEARALSFGFMLKRKWIKFCFSRFNSMGRGEKRKEKELLKREGQLKQVGLKINCAEGAQSIEMRSDERGFKERVHETPSSSMLKTQQCLCLYLCLSFFLSCIHSISWTRSIRLFSFFSIVHFISFERELKKIQLFSFLYFKRIRSF